MYYFFGLGAAGAGLLLLTAAPSNSQLGPLITANDYPPTALRAHHQGTVRFALTIGTNGRVDACRITESSGYSELDAATCRIMIRRARFKPAQDQNGKPVESTYESFVDWRLSS